MLKKSLSKVLLFSVSLVSYLYASVDNTNGVISWKVLVKKYENPKKEILHKILTSDLNKEAFNYVNTMRQKVGMILLNYNDFLAKAAQNHAQYLIDNNFAPSHYESSGYPGYTGITPSDRAVYAGYLSRKVSENLSAGDTDPKDSVDNLFSAIYHRLGFLDFSINEIGIGNYENDDYVYKSIFVYDMGNSLLNSLCLENVSVDSGTYIYNICKDKDKKIPLIDYQNAIDKIEKQNAKIVFWPPKDYNDTPPVFYEESPDPLPDYSVSGYPISIQFNPYFYNSENITLESFNLYNDNGELIDTIYMDKNSDPNNEFPNLAYAIFPKKRLDWGKEYYVKAVFNINNKEETFNWEFKTKTLPYAFYKITTDEASLNIKPNKAYALYLVPLNNNDTIMSFKALYQTNDKIEINFIDQNTLYIKVNGNTGDKIILDLSDNRKLTLVLADKDNAIYFDENQSAEKNTSVQTYQSEEQNNTNKTDIYVKNHIQKGWNLFGAIDDIDCNNFDVNFTVLWIYKNGIWKAYSKNNQIKELIKEKNILEVDKIYKGEGFWIFK